HNFSDGIGKKISTNSIKDASRLEESKKVTEELKTNVLSNLRSSKEQLENLKEQRDKILSKNFFGKSRIIKAFPQISSSKYKQELEHIKKKIIGTNQDEDNSDPDKPEL
ncbi:hypothetical protein, partial [Anaerocolumna aminovalerica]|uniref:hypothetical protein n=1 Tax=Anaerocolumna aminovalerica TaxID=1527 RepID=UPI002ED41115